MRVILELRTGPHAGRKTWLQTGQTLQVGNTEDADFVVVDDVEMSNVHFSIAARRADCLLSDLQSENGTFVNGQQIQQAELADGDEIRAGHTVISVKIDGVKPSPVTAEVVTSPLPATGPAPVDRAAAPRRVVPARASQASRASTNAGPIRYKREECGSGLVLLSSIQAKDDPALVARRVAIAASLYLLVDCEKAKLQLPADVQEPVYLLEWLPENARAAISPVVLRPGESSSWPQVVAEAWGKDGLVGFFSKLEPEKALARLRRAARYNPTTGVELEDETALSIWWPDVLRLILIHSPPAQVSYLLEEIDAVLIEAPGGRGWQLFASKDFADKLDAQGFELSDPATET